MKISWKTNKGITLVTLAMAIIIMLIIASVLIYNANTGNQIQKLNKMYQDIQLLSDKIAIYYSQYRALPVLEQKYINTAQIGDKNINDNEVYYVINLEALENITLNYGNEYVTFKNGEEGVEDIYIVNEQSHIVYYAKGIELDGKQYYTQSKETTKVELPVMSQIESYSRTGATGHIVIKAVDREKGMQSLQILINDVVYKTISYTEKQTQVRIEELDIPLAFGKDTEIIAQVVSQDNTKTESNPLLLRNEDTIVTKEDLFQFATLVNNGDTFENKRVKIANDINLEGNNANPWEPIAANSNEFLGTIEGNQKTISGIYIQTTKNNQAFMENNKGIIQNLTVQGSITGATGCAGLVAKNYHIIQNCVNEITVQINTNHLAGGIVAQNMKHANISSCLNKAPITAMGQDQNGNSFCGGIAGENEGVIELCYNTAIITGTQTVGGIVGGLYEDTIRNCYNTGAITATTNVGGIVGLANLANIHEKDFIAVENTYSIGNIQGTIGIGGIIGAKGECKSNILNNYYLQGSAIGGINSTDITGSVQMKTGEELKNSVTLLGEAFKSDNQTINQGYPILTWQ